MYDKKLSNQRQVQWSEFSSRFDYQIVYTPGIFDGKADALTRRPGDLPEGVDDRLENMEQAVLTLQNLPEQLCLLADSPPVMGRLTISDLMTEAYMTDPLPEKIMETIRMGSGLQEISIAECIKEDGRIQYRGKLYVPESDALCLWTIQEYHDTASAGHPGQVQTFDLLGRQFNSKEMQSIVDRNLWNSHSCEQSRSSRP